MNIDIRYIPREVSEWDVTRAIANILHGDEFPVSEEEREINFKVELDDDDVSGVGHKGSGTLTVPQAAIGRKFLAVVKETPVRVAGKKLKFFRSHKPPPRHLSETLDRTPFVPPDIEERFVKTVWALDESIRVQTVQFGTYFRETYPGGRSYSIEWSKDYKTKGSAWLRFEYEHKLIRIKVSATSWYLIVVSLSCGQQIGDEMTEHLGYTIAINFASIRTIGIGYDFEPCEPLVYP